MQIRSYHITLLALAAWAWLQPIKPTPLTKMPDYFVQLPAQWEIWLYNGDRHLAANMNVARFLFKNKTDDVENIKQQAQLHRNISLFNPCNEDNYYIANATLNWGGLPNEAEHILRKANDCRYWDEWPAFFLGINQSLFLKDQDSAEKWMRLASSRASDPTNKTSFLSMGIGMKANSIKNVENAINYLKIEKENSNDQKIQKSLQKRITRLEGLKTLKDAQIKFNQKMGFQLEDPWDLIKQKILTDFPKDPTGLGYNFENGEFTLIKIGQRQ